MPSLSGDGSGQISIGDLEEWDFRIRTLGYEATTMDGTAAGAGIIYVEPELCPPAYHLSLVTRVHGKDGRFLIVAGKINWII